MPGVGTARFGGRRTGGALPRLLLAARTNTPLRPLRVGLGSGFRRLWLKLEMGNPTGSVKYRTALGLLATLDVERPLLPGSRVVESTSGNLGLALAHVLGGLDCQLVAVVDPKVPPDTRAQLESMGAEVVAIHERDDHGGYLLTRLAKVRQLCRADPDLRWTNQYQNPANPNVHRDTVADELVRQTGGSVDAVLVAVSTGGTLAGISDGLRSGAPAARIYAVDVRGSVVTSDESGPHLLTGIGATRKSSFLRRAHYDAAVRVTDVEAFAYCRMLARDTGLALGGSSGAVLAAFVQAGGAPEGSGSGLAAARCAAAVMADGGANYRATFYDDGWLAAHGVLDGVRAAEAVARERGVRFDLEGGGR
ncbi:cysteine synthase family protein [Micromonosporaceae bacterium B7E4]